MEDVDQTKGKSRSRLKAEESAKKIFEKMKEAKESSYTDRDYVDLVNRIMKSMSKAARKRQDKAYMKDGVQFITENKDRISMFKIDCESMGYAVGIGIMDVNGDSKKFEIATCICSPRDYDSWSDKVAKGYIGNRLMGCPLVIEYPEKVSVKYVAYCVNSKVVSDACLNIKGPRFMGRMFSKQGDFASTTVTKILLGRKGKDESSGNK